MLTPKVERLKNHENAMINTAVTITPNNCVQEMETPAKLIGLSGKNTGKE